MTAPAVTHSESALSGGTWRSGLFAAAMPGEEKHQDWWTHPVLLWPETPMVITLVSSEVLDSASFGFEEAIASRLSIPGVAAIYAVFEERDLRVWVITESRDPQLRSRIHAEEHEIIQKFPGFRFEFSAISTEGRSILLVAPKEGTLIWARDAGSVGPRRAG